MAAYSHRDDEQSLGVATAVRAALAPSQGHELPLVPPQMGIPIWVPTFPPFLFPHL